ncbi:MAG: sigma-70 family RNA polymerase sigma factor [Defluviitaleaceae bacterium]|nr:sigma-70 family RNA polymerase sigma factor [Defluviitaleaceae bacterium]
MNYAKMTDYELVAACIEGEKNSFEELVSRYKNLVYSVVLRMVTDKEDANDLAQEVFIKIYRNLEKYSEEYKFSTWTIRIATNHVIDWRRKKKYETVSIDDEENTVAGGLMANSGASPEDEYIADEQSRMLRDLVAGLPDIYRVPIVLYHEQGLSYQEISEITGEPLSKVKNRIFRGRKLLKESLMNLRRGGESYGVGM